MKTINVRELRVQMPTLSATLALQGEMVLVSNGTPIARLLPMAPAPAPRKLESLAAFRATLPTFETPTQDLIRADRDRRGT